MAYIPCGKGPNAIPLTSVEAATLVGIQRWVLANRTYFKMTNISTYMLMVGFAIPVIDIIFWSGLFIGLGLIIIIIASVMLLMRKLVPVRFPAPLITVHPWAMYRNIPHLVTSCPDALLPISLKGGYSSYQGHDPALIQGTDPLSMGIREYSYLSVDSLTRLHQDVSTYNAHVTGQQTVSGSAQILTGEAAAHVAQFVEGNLTPEQHSLCAQTPHFEHGGMECHHTQNLFYEVQRIIDSNNVVNNSFRTQIQLDLAHYHSWRDQLSAIGEEWVVTVLLSASEGWERMADASSNASEFLTRSVQDRIDEMISRIDADAREAEAELASKMSEIEAEVAAKGVDLQHQITAQENVLTMAGQSLVKIEKTHIPVSISLQIPVANVTGGGGRISDGSGYVDTVQTNISFETVSMENPAHHMRGQMLELANSAAMIEEARLGGLKQQRSGLDNLVEERRASINERKEQRKADADARMEEEKEVALKHARSVESLFSDVKDNEQLLDFNDINHIMTSVWTRPASVLNAKIEPLENEISSLHSMFHEVERNANHIEALLSASALSTLPHDNLNVHWIIESDGQITENIEARPLEVFQVESVHVRASLIESLLTPQVSSTQVPQLSDAVLQNAISHLEHKGWFGKQLQKFLKKMKMSNLRVMSAKNPQIAMQER